MAMEALCWGVLWRWGFMVMGRYGDGALWRWGVMAMGHYGGGALWWGALWWLGVTTGYHWNKSHIFIVFIWRIYFLNTFTLFFILTIPVLIMTCTVDSHWYTGLTQLSCISQNLAVIGMQYFLSAFTMQKCHLQNREPVSFSSIPSRNDVGCVERSDRGFFILF